MFSKAKKYANIKREACDFLPGGDEIFFEVERGDRVEDEAVIALVRELLVEENAFCFKMSCDWVDSIDQSQQYELADGIGIPLIEDSVEIYEREDGLYYVTVLTNSDMEGSKNTYILEKVGEGKHMFRIVAKTGLL